MCSCPPPEAKQVHFHWRVVQDRRSSFLCPSAPEVDFGSHFGTQKGPKIMKKWGRNSKKNRKRKKSPTRAPKVATPIIGSDHRGAPGPVYGGRGGTTKRNTTDYLTRPWAVGPANFHRFAHTAGPGKRNRWIHGSTGRWFDRSMGGLLEGLVGRWVDGLVGRRPGCFAEALGDRKRKRAFKNKKGHLKRTP